MIRIGQYNSLRVVKEVDFGLYLDAGDKEILLPKRFVPQGAKPGDVLEVFLYHDSENRPIATTQKPKGTVGEIVLLKCAGVTPQGAFMEMGIMKDLFVPLSQQVARMYEGQSYLVLIYIDEQTGRMAGTEKFQSMLSNEELTVHEGEELQATVWQKTDIGYKAILRHRHTGVIHFDDTPRELSYGEVVTVFIKNIRPDNKIDLVAGLKGYKKVLTEKEKIISLLQDHNGYLPYNDASAPEEIASFFGMSKKTFKMTIGSLYKERKIALTKTGIRLL